MKCKKCLMALTAAITMGIWYVVGVLSVQLLPVNIIKIAPQLLLVKGLAPVASDMGAMNLLIGLVQIFIMTFLFIWIAAGIHGRLAKRK